MNIKIAFNKMVYCPLNEYKNILGTPGKGTHSYRFLDTAIVDYILSIILAMTITYYSKIPLVLTTISVLIVGILLHMLFGVNTNTIEYIGLSCRQ